MPSSYRDSHTREGYGAHYDETILRNYDGHLWRTVEAPMLERWLGRAVDRGASNALDFACGTGRISEVLRRHLTSVTGIDVSATMLEQARKRCPDVTFLERDISRGDVADLPRFDLITAFRFFQGAEDELRQEVLTRLRALLNPGGELIVNVQMNGEGPGRVIQAAKMATGRRPGYVLTRPILANLLAAHGFEVVETVWYGFWPRTGRFFPGVARRMQQPAAAVVSRLGLPQHRFAQMFAVRALPV